MKEDIEFSKETEEKVFGFLRKNKYRYDKADEILRELLKEYRQEVPEMFEVCESEDEIGIWILQAAYDNLEKWNLLRIGIPEELLWDGDDEEE